MASTPSDTPKAANPLTDHGDHDRVTMLSLHVDGTPNQHNPEIIGDKEWAIAATKRQFAEQAVSAVDVVRRPELGLAGRPDDGDTSDKAIDALKKEHDAAAEAAEKRAESVVNQLHKG